MRERASRFPKGAKEKGGQREENCARAGRDTRATGMENGQGMWVRTGGGLKGSERLDKSNPLKVRPTLCLPMRLRIRRLAACQIRPESSAGPPRKFRVTTGAQSDGENDDEGDEGRLKFARFYHV